ncbi:MAG: BON domain-containing protein [Desulfobacteraceae bacterium]|nr:MAG: BON domain-containing protein [Desulfobacteraceae bacterium]
MAIITISRGTFSGGKTIAECLGKKLGYPVLSREETLSEAARTYRISEEEVSAALENPPLFQEQAPGKRFSYLRCLTAVLLDRAENGNLIYHGHAGHFLLGAVSHVLRVRIIANIEFRISAAMAEMKKSREEVIAYIENVDRKRQKWTRFLYGVDWRDASLYDMVLNLEHMSIEGACLSVAQTALLDDFKVTPASLQAQKDLLLSSRVWIALAKDERTRTAFVNVAADKGKVAVRGNVGSEKVINAIPLIAKSVEGVREVITDVGTGSDWYW